MSQKNQNKDELEKELLFLEKEIQKLIKELEEIDKSLLRGKYMLSLFNENYIKVKGQLDAYKIKGLQENKVIIHKGGK